VSQSCECGCATYGAHLRNKGVRVAYTNSTSNQDYSTQKRWDRELDRYRSVVAQGIEPEGTTHRDMDRAEKALND
jgi:hypothetical protein